MPFQDFGVLLVTRSLLKLVRRVAFADWVPGLLATFGMILVNLLDKEQLVDADDTSDTKWRARLVLFLGFACMAGG